MSNLIIYVNLPYVYVHEEDKFEGIDPVTYPHVKDWYFKYNTYNYSKTIKILLINSY